MEIKKQKRRAFGKDIYLLGEDENNIKYWLEEPSWDCGWYWGFGYIETYTNNANPERAKDISSHQHANNFMSEFFIELNGSKPILVNQTFSEDEGWELSELFEQFYFLQKAANYFNKGKANVSETKITWKKPKLSEEINKILIPKVTDRILEILS